MDEFCQEYPLPNSPEILWKLYPWCILTLGIILWPTVARLKCRRVLECTLLLCSKQRYFRLSLSGVFTGMMNNPELHIAVSAPASEHAYACPHTRAASHNNMHIHEYKVTLVNMSRIHLCKICIKCGVLELNLELI